MPPTPEKYSFRISLLSELVSKVPQRKIVEEPLQAVVKERELGGPGGWDSALEGLSDRLPQEEVAAG